MTVRIDSLIEPRCTGMCGALAIRAPSASNSAQLKSSRSLMLTEWAVFCSRSPICSAIFMNRLLNTSSMIGSARVPGAAAAGRGRTRRSSRFPQRRDGPSASPARPRWWRCARDDGRTVDRQRPSRDARRRRGWRVRQPAGSSSARQYIGTSDRAGRPRTHRWPRRFRGAPRRSCARSRGADAFHRTDSITSARCGIRNAKRRR